MSRSLVRRALRLAALVAVALAALAVTAVATGRIDYVVTNGVSMEPLYHQGDLVVVAHADHYAIGDIIAYHDAAKGIVVLHRIVGGDAAGWIMRGDNNQSEDSVRPSSSQVIGRAIAHAPWIGHFFGSLAGGIALAGLIAIVAFGFTSIGRRSADGDESDGAELRRRIGPLVAALILADVLVAVAAVASFAYPERPAPAPPPLMLRGLLRYGADVPPSDIYPDGHITTGDPVFTRVAHTITVTVDLDTDASADRVTGAAQLDLELSNSVGWRTRVHLVSTRPLVDGTVHLSSSVDVAHLQAIATNVATTTGINAGSLALSIVASGSTSTDGGTPADYSLSYPFALSDLALTVSGPSATIGAHGPELSATQALSTAPTTGPQRGFSTLARRLLLIALVLALTLTFLAWPAAPDRTRSRETRPTREATPEPLLEPAQAAGIADGSTGITSSATHVLLDDARGFW
jgi:signal peptidase I